MHYAQWHCVVYSRASYLLNAMMYYCTAQWKKPVYLLCVRVMRLGLSIFGFPKTDIGY